MDVNENKKKIKNKISSVISTGDERPYESNGDDEEYETPATEEQNNSLFMINNNEEQSQAVIKNKGSSAEVLEDSEFLEDEPFLEEKLFEEITNTEETLLNDGVNNEDAKGKISSKQKYPFLLKQNQNGNILSVHHTVREQNKMLRIRLGVCSFNRSGTQFVVIDKRGNIFVFDLVVKRYWRLLDKLMKATVIKPSAMNSKHYLVGTKLGDILLLDTETAWITKTNSLSKDAIKEISFPGQPLQPPNIALVKAGHQAILFDLNNFSATYRLDLDDISISLKFASYLPFSENIFTCFTNDSLYIWSGVTLNNLRVVHPIKARDKKLRLLQAHCTLEFCLGIENCSEYIFDCQDMDYSNGQIVSYCYSPDGTMICLTTIDNYILLLSSYTFDLEKIFRTKDFIVMECAFLPKPKEILIFCLTGKNQVVLLDCQSVEMKMMVQAQYAIHMNISENGKLLCILTNKGEADIWSTCQLYNKFKSQEKRVQMLKSSLKHTKPISLLVPNNDCFYDEMKKLLKRNRLLNILREYGNYPAKYRTLIWCALLKLPYNRTEFQKILKQSPPLEIKTKAQHIILKNESLKRALVKVWSCLGHWCKVFIYADFVPKLIFPFIKLFPKNILVAFEICATLLLNHFELWFEFHPMEPKNYLGMCENLLQYFDPGLSKFYAKLNITPKYYAWSILSNAFSEVLDQDQWLYLWDNILSCQTYFILFCCVAYNIVQREVIMRLTSKNDVSNYFYEQNPIDVCHLKTKALWLVSKCPPALHPNRYIKCFKSIPKSVYPKFLNYPKEWIARHEQQMKTMQDEQQIIDARLRQLELEEMHMIERLESGLKDEEHTKRIKEMEKLYRDSIKREEERIAFQNKMLLIYQKEIRNRKGEVIVTLKQSEERKKMLEMEKELDQLWHTIETERLRNETNLLLAEDEVRNQDMELLAQQQNANNPKQSFSQKYSDDIKRLFNARQNLNCNIKNVPFGFTRSLDNSLKDIENQFNEIQKEFKCLQNRN